MSILDSSFGRSCSRVLMVVLATGAAGCTTLPEGKGYTETNALLTDRLGVAPDYSGGDNAVLATDELPIAPIDPETAMKLAFLRSPRVAQVYSRIGLSRADLEGARRLINPGLGVSYLDSSRGGEQITRSLTLSVTDLLLRPVRKRYAAATLQQMQLQVAGELQALATDAEVSWYHAAAAEQIANTRALIAKSAQQSALLAQRFFAAGNINRLQLAQERAAAATANIESVRARARALQARTALANVLALPVEAPWTLSPLPALPDSDAVEPDELLRLSIEQRLDLAAARQQLDLREDSFAMARRWRWLGRFEVGYERESEAEGGVMHGPTFAIELPFFNQGQDVTERAWAQRTEALAHLDQMLLDVRNEVRGAVAGVQMAREVTEHYLNELVPAREDVVARTQEEVNFMLKGIFELILAKQAGYDAWQGYLEAVRDYWIEYTRLRVAVGGRLPDQPVQNKPLELQPAPAAPSHEHGDR